MQNQTIAKPGPILGIETSCDETGVAVFDPDRGLLAHTLYSQTRMHADYGGVVPELASRDHVRKLRAYCQLYGIEARDPATLGLMRVRSSGASRR